MLGGHLPELMLVLVGALIIFGPKRLPEIGGSLGKGIRDFKRSVSDIDQPAPLTDSGRPVTEQGVSEHEAS